MPNYILYHAATPDDVNATAYALIKHLGNYNLKPPADEKLVVFTNDPARLEAYSTFFSSFTFRPATTDALNTLRQFSSGEKASLLYFGPAIYPVLPLQSIFHSIEKGVIYAGMSRQDGENSVQRQISLLGFHSGLHPFQLDELEKGRSADHFTEQYKDLPGFHLLLRKFFKRYAEESVSNQVKLASGIDLKRIREQKQQYDRLPLYKKITRRVTGKGWNMADFVR